MRRAGAPMAMLATLALAIAIGLAALPSAGDTGLEPIVDAIPSRPSPHARAAEIARRIQREIIYPELARRRGIQGTTLLRLRVGPNGRATELETAASSGSASLDAAAHAGAEAARDLPAVYGRVEVPIRFSLESQGLR